MFCGKARSIGGASFVLRSIPVLFLTLAGASCTSRGASEAPGARAAYDCGDVPVRVEYRGDSAFVALRDTSFVLPIARSASGARYSDGTSTVWEHQGALRVELPDTVFEHCPRRGAGEGM